MMQTPYFPESKNGGSQVPISTVELTKSNLPVTMSQASLMSRDRDRWNRASSDITNPLGFFNSK